LVEGQFSHWLRTIPTTEGRFRFNVDRHWDVKDDNTADLTFQSRFIYMMATGYELTGDSRYRIQAKAGANFLLAKMRDGEFGGFYDRVSRDGKPIYAIKRTYGNAFAIFALAHAYKCIGDKRYLDAAMDNWYILKRNMRDPDGGLALAANREFTRHEGVNSQNPLMHVFEALIALYDASGSAAILADAAELANFVVRRLYVPAASVTGYIPEYYDPMWRPERMDRDGYVDLGHQMEWAYLLSAGVERGLPENYLVIANTLIDYVLANGYDRGNGGIFEKTDYSGNITERRKLWWPQCELLRTLMHFAAKRGRGDLWDRFEESLALIKTEFLDEVNGGWYPQPKADCVQGDCVNMQAEPYHMTGMYMEALRLSAIH
jgi:mannose/cellobiose epimerase-like protein (N-acyl-D-glucosamine 2-epimerase family)